MTKDPVPLSKNDRDALRELARRKAEIAADPVNVEHRDLWYALDEGRADNELLGQDIFALLILRLATLILDH